MSNETLVLNRAARGMFKRAVATTATQLGLKKPDKVIEALREGNCQQCEKLRFSLARQVADYLGTVDSDMRAIYFFDPEYASGDYSSSHAGPSQSSAINLIAWTRTKTSTPPQVIQGLHDALQHACTDILCPNASGLCFSLNVALVNDAEVKSRRGYAAMIDSVNVRPTQVWVRVPRSAQPKSAVPRHHVQKKHSRS